jgi:hypothetical protein
MVVSYGCVTTKIVDGRKYMLIASRFDCHGNAPGAIQFALPNRGGSGLQEKPLDTSIV